MLILTLSKAIFGLVVALSAVDAISPTVDLTVVAPWSAPNLLINIAETIATYNESAYSHLLPELISIQQTASRAAWTPYQIYKEALEIIKDDVDHVDFFKISLAVHEATPRIAAYHKYYEQNVMPSIDNYDDQCDSWIQLNDKQYCDMAMFNDRLNSAISISSIPLLPFDHILSDNGGAGTVILYTDTFSASFGILHDHLTSVCKEKGITYVIRYKPSREEHPLYLAGYGVGLSLKNTDYLVIDDREDTSVKESIRDRVAHLGKRLGKSLFQSADDAKIEPLTPKEIEFIGLKAAQYVARADNPLLAMTQLLQDFPRYAKSVSAIELDVLFQQEIMQNQQSFIQPGMNGVWLNGRALDDSQVDPFYLVRALRSEYRLIASLKQLGLTSEQAIGVITNPILFNANKEADSGLTDFYDVRDTAENPFVIWWNDIEKDSRYKEWTSDIYTIFQPIYPGQLHHIRKNLYNLLFVEDLGQEESLNRIINELHLIIQRSLPMHLGLVAIVKEDDSVSTIMAKLLNFLIKEEGRANGMKFLQYVSESMQLQSLSSPSPDIIKQAYYKVTSRVMNDVTYEDALSSQDGYAMATQSFLRRLDLTNDSGIIFFNGKLLQITAERPWTHAVMNQMQEQVRLIQSKLYSRELGPDDVVYDFLLDQPHVNKIRNSYIVVSEAKPIHLMNFKHVIHANVLRYLQSNENDVKTSTNMWILADFNTQHGVQLAQNALSFTKSNPKVRTALVHIPQVNSNIQITEKKPYEPRFSDFLANALYTKQTSLDEIYALLEHVSFDKEAPVFVDQTSFLIPGSPVIEMELIEESKKWNDILSAFEKDGLDANYSGIILNGRAIGPLVDAVFSQDDFNELFQYEKTKRIGIIESVIEQSELHYDDHSYADTVQSLTAIIEMDKLNIEKSITTNVQPTYRNKVYERITSAKESKMTIGKDKDTFLEIALLIDPLTEIAQKWAPLFYSLSQIQGVSVTVYLNPENGLKELPLKRFYRYIFDNEPHFNSKGQQETPTAYFEGLPVDTLYTLGVDTTNAWLVTVREANMDLDNILFSSQSEKSVVAVYELESILVEGHCLDKGDKSPPRGLEFEIDTASNYYWNKKDTLVMANYGYFQLKALPGMWRLAIREGRSSEVYSIHNVATHGEFEWNTEDGGDSDVILALTSFEGLTVLPLVQKNPGMEKEDVLEFSIAKDKKGLWSSLTNKFFSKKESTDIMKPKQADINIFSVASGKLYERFLSIMIASVMKHTKSTVKFWFIENFLSPEFKDFVPHMATEYGFDYEMVTYKWPAWLRAQHEKQRIIWGYKILFLDVLFPLGLDKVIFVDADQIVRTDLKELIDMDLKGAPYGYTPFCTDKPEMDGFKFWTEGYWKSHLRGKPYHISALYVVDLVRFRQLAAGDRLRAQYQQLSADPNSLANLDQDLPNNMQDTVPIFSLPQEWLWCETWCSDASLKTAKTIDLCNNPLTKEPKLDRARRQVPEWEAYDHEIDLLRQKIAKKVGSSESTNKNAKPSKDEL